MGTSGLHHFALLAGGLMAGAIAQAQTPPQASKSSGPALPAAPVAAPAQKGAQGKAAAAVAAKPAAAQKPAALSPQLVRDARDAGFRPQNIRGNLMFCRVAVELGSNFPVRTCYDEEQVRVKIHEYQAERNQLYQQHFLPPPVPRQECRPNC